MSDRDLVLDAIAVFRLSRLVTDDIITQPIRARIIQFAYDWRDGSSAPMSDASWDKQPEYDDDAPKLADFIRCYWCTSLWISAGVVLARRYAPEVWEPFATVLALSAVGSLLAGLVE